MGLRFGKHYSNISIVSHRILIWHIFQKYFFRNNRLEIVKTPSDGVYHEINVQNKIMNKIIGK